MRAVIGVRCASRGAVAPIHAGHVFDQSSRRQRRPLPLSTARSLSPPPSAVAFRGAAASSCHLASVHNMHRIRSRVVALCKNREGYIPRSCTTCMSLTPPAVPSGLPLVMSADLASSDVAQRSDEWFALRKDRLTTSSFSNALGFWRGNSRAVLWHEKVYEPDEVVFTAGARAAMDWGVEHESTAIDRYKALTGLEVSHLGFVVHAGSGCGWLGASPDGVLGSNPDGGILEVKCPYNKGKPASALPWRVIPYYYVPQVQGQMEIMDRDWLDFYCWTPVGSSIFRVQRDRPYWELISRPLHEFWWGHVVPAREARLADRHGDVMAFKPTPRHELTNEVVARSRKLAREAALLCIDIGGHVELFS